jgi:hypothetical protein
VLGSLGILVLSPGLLESCLVSWLIPGCGLGCWSLSWLRIWLWLAGWLASWLAAWELGCLWVSWWFWDTVSELLGWRCTSPSWAPLFAWLVTGCWLCISLAAHANWLALVGLPFGLLGTCWWQLAATSWALAAWLALVGLPLGLFGSPVTWLIWLPGSAPGASGWTWLGTGFCPAVPPPDTRSWWSWAGPVPCVPCWSWPGSRGRGC